MSKLEKVKKRDELYKRAARLFHMSGTELSQVMAGALSDWIEGKVSSTWLCEQIMVKLYKSYEKNKWMRIKDS